ncbi:MAG: S1C family serine protease [Spirochaetota bacterium]
MTRFFRSMRTFRFLPVLSLAALLSGQETVSFTGGEEMQKKVQNSLVSISCKAKGITYGYRRWMDRGTSTGAGVFISKDGLIVTAYSLVASPETITVKMADGKQSGATLVGFDPFIDVAVIKLNSGEAPDMLAFDTTDSITADAVAIAGGFREGNAPTLIPITVSRLGRMGIGIAYIENFIQFSADVVPEDLGGPLIDQSGNIVGVNVMTGTKRAGVGLTVPASMVRASFASISQGGKVQYPFLGVYVRELRNIKDFNYPAEGLPQEGLFVLGVPDDSPAKNAGINFGDAIIEVNGVAVTSYSDMYQALAGKAVGDQTSVVLLRKGSRMQATVALAERPLLPVFNIPNFCRLFLGFDVGKETISPTHTAYTVKKVYFFGAKKKEGPYGEGDYIVQIAPGKPYGVPEPIRENAQMAALIYPDSIVLDDSEYGLDLFFAKRPDQFGSRAVFQGSMKKISF